MTKTLLAVGALTAWFVGSAAVGAQPRELGFLAVSSEPRAKILIDSQPTGLWTPQTMALRPGHHRLTLIRPEGDRRPSSYGFAIEARETTRIAIHLAY
jgi:hypothetical protein